MTPTPRLLHGGAQPSPPRLQIDSEDYRLDLAERRRASAKASYLRRKADNPEVFRAARREQERKAKEKDPDGFAQRKRAASRAYTARNLEKVRASSRARAKMSRANDPAKHKAATSKWRAANIEKVRATDRKAWRRRMQIPSNALRARISTLVRMSLKRRGKSASIDSALGFTVEELRQHLERQFVGGMSWENMGLWQIDHIVPMSSFSFECESDDGFKRAWHITNLRPLWGKENARKGARITHLL